MTIYNTDCPLCGQHIPKLTTEAVRQHVEQNHPELFSKIETFFKKLELDHLEHQQNSNHKLMHEDDPLFKEMIAKTHSDENIIYHLKHMGQEMLDALVPIMAKYHTPEHPLDVFVLAKVCSSTLAFLLAGAITNDLSIIEQGATHAQFLKTFDENYIEASAQATERIL